MRAGDDFSLDNQEPTDSGAAVQASLFRSIYDGIWDAFKQSIDNEAE